MSNQYQYRKADKGLYGPVTMEKPSGAPYSFQTTGTIQYEKKKKEYENYLASLPRVASVPSCEWKDGEIVEDTRFKLYAKNGDESNLIAVPISGGEVKKEESDMVYCNYCKCETLQVFETTGMRCQKCENQNPFGNCSAKDYGEYLKDLVAVNNIQNHEDLMAYYEKNRNELGKFMDKIIGVKEEETKLPERLKQLDSLNKGEEGTTITDLLELLKFYGGKIISSNNMTPEEIAESREGGRFYVDDNGFGFSWEFDRFPTTEKEVELYEKWYPSPVDESKIPTWESIEKRIEEEKQKKLN